MPQTPVDEPTPRSLGGRRAGAPGPWASDQAAVRRLVLAHGWNATAYQLVNPGIAHWFSDHGDAVVGYVRHAGVVVVAGAPVCSAARLAGVVAEFEEAARRAGDRVCYFGAEARLEVLLRDSPHHARVVLGAQPAWRPAHWASATGRRASLRAQLNRARNKGVQVHEWPASRARVAPELRRVLTEWLGTRGLPALHFLVEPETLSRLDDCRVFVAERAQAVVAFLVASPIPARQGWLVEQVVRGVGAPNGTNELLIDAAMRAFAAHDALYATLGLAPLSLRANARVPPTPLWLRATLEWTRAHGRRFYNFEGLDGFKAKLAPEGWEPVYAIVNEARFPPRAVYAIAAAFSAGSPIAFLARGASRALRAEIGWLVDGRRRAPSSRPM